MISYAQNYEDVLINRFFADEPPQRYVDVGAGHPSLHSVTRHFYENGWSGLNLEPRRRLVEKYSSERERDTTLWLAVSNQSGTLPFFEVNVLTDTSGDQGGLSTLDRQLADHYRDLGYEVVEREIQVETLSQVLDDTQTTEIGFLKIDVEGHECEVVEGMDWNRWRPRLVILECTIPRSSDSADPTASNTILEHGYSQVFFDGLNQFFVRQEDRRKADRFKLPVNVFDNFVTSREVNLQQALERANEKIRLLERESSERGRDSVHLAADFQRL